MNEYDSKNLIDKMKKSFLIAISSDIETFKYISRNAFHSLQKIKLNLPHPVIIWKPKFLERYRQRKISFWKDTHTSMAA
jgi:hypothetical protein